MDGGAWWATIHGVAKSRTRLSDFTHSLRMQYIIQDPHYSGVICTFNHIAFGLVSRKLHTWFLTKCCSSQRRASLRKQAGCPCRRDKYRRDDWPVHSPSHPTELTQRPPAKQAQRTTVFYAYLKPRP